MSVAALVLGIIGFIAAFIPIGSYVAILLAILAVIFGIIGIRRRTRRGMAIAGTILGGLGLIAAIIMSIIYTQYFVAVGDCLDHYPSGQGAQFRQCVQDRARGLTD